MKWQGRQRSTNIEDRRTSRGGGGLGGGLNPFGRSGGGFGGGLPGGFPRSGGTSRGGIGGIGGILGIIIVLGIVWLVFGQNPIDVLTGGSGSTTSFNPTSSGTLTSEEEDELAGLVGVVVKDTEDLWTREFQARGETYTEPTVVLFTEQTQSGCGEASASSGPFYCPVDQKVYVDLAFYDQLRTQFGAPGDFAQGYVIAHEIGHHVQTLTGALGAFNDARGRMSEDQVNAYSVRIELQADCYAGIWANYANQQGIVESGDAEEAITAANAIGDDTLTGGTVPSRNFTHGTSEQRMHWLQVGMQSGRMEDCDTLSGNI
jgi:uncharacterized protein